MSSSGDDFVDLDQELSSAESTSSESSFKTKQISNKIKKDMNINLKELEKQDEEDDSEQGLYKVIGQLDGQVVAEKKTKKFVEPWIANAHKFSSKMIGNSGNLLPLDDLLTFGLKQEFINILNTYTNIWFPVQSTVLPILLNNKNEFLPPRDVVICSPTGSGKTLCYVLPILNNIHFVEDTSAVFALIIAPSASLAEQIFKEFEKFNVFNAKIVALYGNTSYFHERLLDHLMDDDGNFINLSMLRFLVIDEADKMHDTARIEWLEVVERLSCASLASTNNLSISSLTNNFKQNCHLQRILVSATLLLDINKLYIWNLRCPQLFLATNNEEENKQGGEDQQQINIFLPESLSHKIIRILIACDMFSRGVDVQDVDCVINYDVPINERIFIHRAGRTARAMKGGLLLSLCTKDEKMRLKKQLIGHNLWKNIEELNDYKGPNEEEIKHYKEALAQLESECLPKVRRRRRKVKK
uniref:ATP-dependent RNA helicase n=1 Tax=Meloidogyne hapla TaxID=6305 RepID=A0A1I8B730_MELHA